MRSRNEHIPSTDECLNKREEFRNHAAKDKIKYLDGSQWYNDTLFYFNHHIWPGFGCFFPIIYTNTIDTTATTSDTCMTTTGLRIMDVQNNDIVLTWDMNGGDKWELSLVKGDTSSAVAENGIINIYSINNFASFLDLDTACYTAFIRTVCNNDIRSEWSRGVSFCLPMQDTTNNITAESLTDAFTFIYPNPAGNAVSIFSSFQIHNIDIFTLDGKLLSSHTAKGISANIWLADLPAGTYILRIRTAGGTTTKKLIKR